MNEPRPHHYQFAHERLPELVNRFSDSFLGLLAIKSDGYLKGIWYRLGCNVEREERLVADGLRLDCFENKHFCGAVITLPEAKYQPEAHMVALVGELISGSLLADSFQGVKYHSLRYFTLERSVEKRNTSLGEWTGGRHAIYGPGPIVEPQAFWAHCIRHISNEPD